MARARRSVRLGITPSREGSAARDALSIEKQSSSYTSPVVHLQQINRRLQPRGLAITVFREHGHTSVKIDA